MKNTKTQLARLVAALTLLALPTLNSHLSTAYGQGTAFTYQGQLQNTGGPANGSYDLTFALYDAGTNGSQFGLMFTNSAVAITNGLFTVTEDFGVAFNGTAYWLQIGVRTNGGGLFIPLMPRQQVTPTPYAIFAEGLTLPAMGAVYAGGSSVLISDNDFDFYGGKLAGNLTTSGFGNTGLGFTALAHNGSGSYNTAVGADALALSTSASYNTAVGVEALENTSGGNNVGEGYQALFSNTTGSNNTANGAAALYANLTGNYNTAVGNEAMKSTAGNDNSEVAIGFQALENDNAGRNPTTFSGDGENTAIGYQALRLDTLGLGNTALGYQALYANTNGIYNTATGDSALSVNTSGNDNAALGSYALLANTIGNDNTALGYFALVANTIGNANTAEGSQALLSNTTGNYNTAVGVGAMKATPGDSAEVALGYQALENDNAQGQGTVSGNGENTAVGYQALHLNTIGAANTAIGYQTLKLNTKGAQNTAIGDYALLANLSGNNDTVVGYQAMLNNPAAENDVAIGIGTFQNATEGAQNTAVGAYAFQSQVSGDNNIGIGYNAGKNLTVGANNIFIGNAGSATDSGVIRIGDVQTLTYIAGTVQHLVCSSITIVGGADLAEPFQISTANEKVAGGAVVVIDEENPGHLKLTDRPYDTRVAGVVSGANGLNPAIQMQQLGLIEGGRNVALTGRVYAQADASNGAIKPGDLLTTSSAPGRAMKVSDHARAQGAILGKAMTGLKEGQGMVLVLVTLQ